jgi:hypothetical protein
VVDVKGVVKNRRRNTGEISSAWPACVSRLDQDREIRLSQLFPFRLRSCSLLFAWLAVVSTIKSCRSQVRIHAPTGHSALPPSGDRPTRYLNLAISRLLVHVVGNVSAPYSSVYHFLIPMSHVRFRESAQSQRRSP